MRPFRPNREHDALYGLSAERIAELCRVHVTTARRWKRGEEPPHTAILVLQLARDGELETIDPAFAGWRIRDGRLYPPLDDAGYGPGDIMSIAWLRTIIASYQADQRLPRQADWVSEKWEPAREITA